MPDDPEVPVVCSACGTTTDVALSDLPDAVERHNERLHDGEAVAGVDPAVVDRIHDLAAADVLADGPE